jgi:hypothetical protein
MSRKLMLSMLVLIFVLSGISAQADEFAFSFTETTGVTGSYVPPNFTGTVTGDIWVNNLTGVVTKVTINSVNAPGFTYPFPTLPTSPTQFFVSSGGTVTLTGGNITGMNLVATDSSSLVPPAYEYSNGEIAPAVYSLSLDTHGIGSSWSGSAGSLAYSDPDCNVCSSTVGIVGLNAGYHCCPVKLQGADCK